MPAPAFESSIFPRLPLRALLLGLPLAIGAPIVAASTDLDRCRELRQSEPREGVQVCERAARALADAGSAETAFEAWMHASELASQLGEPQRADAALNAAVALLPRVADPLAAQRVARRRGLNAYREGQPVRALGHFLEALASARAADDAGARAISENDLGVTYRHLGNYEAALASFEASLELRERAGESNLGALLANIGSLYMELGDLGRAERYLQRALEDHQSAGRALPAERTREELARLALRQGQAGHAERLLEQAWQAYLQAQSPRDLERLALLRARQALEAGKRAQAQEWLERARAIRSAEAGDSLGMAIIAARLADTPIEQQRSHAVLLHALEGGAQQAPQQRVEALGELARLAEAFGRLEQAVVHLRQLHREAMALAEARHGERFDGMRVRFDVERLEAEAARRESQLRQRRLETASVAGAALLALAVFGLYSQRRFYRQRLAGERERKALETRIAEARTAAEHLRSDLGSMAWLLDRQGSACLVFDAAGRIRIATAAAAELLARSAQSLQGESLESALGADTAHWAQALVETASLAGERADTADLGCREQLSPRPARLRCQHLSMEEELGVLVFEPLDPEQAAAQTLAAPPAPLESAPVADTATPVAPGVAAAAQIDDAARHEFRRLLVRLMRTALEAWERASRKGRVELAEASGIWRITIDDGRLRVRAMDRYLSLDTLPERPRWREVLRTAYFLLGEVDIGGEHRSQLEAMVEDVLRHTRPQL